MTLNPAPPHGAISRRAQDIKKTFAAFVAVATIAGSHAATPASAQRGVGAAVVGGLIGGAIIGGASPPAARPMAMASASMSRKLPRPAAWFASASGTATAGPIAASRSVAELNFRGEVSRALTFKPGRISAGFLR